MMNVYLVTWHGTVQCVFAELNAAERWVAAQDYPDEYEIVLHTVVDPA